MFFKTAKLIIFGLLILLAIFSLFPLLPPFKGFYKIRAVMSGSMERVVPQGSLIINQWSEDKNLKIGDIITYRRPDVKDFFITHRIIVREKDGLFYFFKTQGDKVPEPDKWRIGQSLIEGKVIFTIPLLGYLYIFVQSPLGFLFLVFLPAGWIIFEEIKNIKKELKSQKIPIISLFILVSFFNQVLPAYAYFSSGSVSLTGINLSVTCDSLSSSIVALADYQKQTNFDLNFSACNNLSKIKEVKLYYSRDLFAPWIYFDSKFPGTNPVADSFSFTSPDGERFYRFITIAIDEAGNIEDDADGNGILETEELDLLLADTWTVVDSQKPVTMLSLVSKLAVANEQIYNGGFENGNLDGWTVEANGSEHLVTTEDKKEGSYSALIGFKNQAATVSSSYVSLNKNLSLPSFTSTLSFWYHLLTDDVVSAGFFDATYKNGTEEIKISHDGWDDPTITETDLGWKNVVYQLNNLVGQNIELQFKISQPEIGYKTWMYLDEIRVTSATNTVIASSQVNLSSHDASGSGTAKTEYKINGGNWQDYIGSINLSEGDQQINYRSADAAGNVESEKQIDINATSSAQIDFGVVINEFLPNPAGDDYAPAPNGEWVELYNNSLITIDVNGWKLKDNLGHESVINVSKTEGAGAVIAPSEKLKIYRRGSGEATGSDFVMNNNGDTISLRKPDDTLIDSFAYTSSVEGKSYKREPNGTGTWKDPVVIQSEMTASISSPSATPVSTPIAEPTPTSKSSITEPSTTLLPTEISILTPVSTTAPSSEKVSNSAPAETASPLPLSSSSLSPALLSNLVETSTLPIAQPTPSPNSILNSPEPSSERKPEENPLPIE